MVRVVSTSCEILLKYPQKTCPQQHARYMCTCVSCHSYNTRPYIHLPPGWDSWEVHRRRQLNVRLVGIVLGSVDGRNSLHSTWDMPWLDLTDIQWSTSTTNGPIRRNMTTMLNTLWVRHYLIEVRNNALTSDNDDGWVELETWGIEGEKDCYTVRGRTWCTHVKTVLWLSRLLSLIMIIISLVWGPFATSHHIGQWPPRTRSTIKMPLNGNLSVNFIAIIGSIKCLYSCDHFWYSSVDTGHSFGCRQLRPWSSHIIFYRDAVGQKCWVSALGKAIRKGIDRVSESQ